MKKYKPYLISILIPLALGAIAGLVTSRGLPAYEQLEKPALTPPAAVFPIVWTILYILMGISAAMIWKSRSSKRDAALSVYVAQLFCNFLWSFLFFGAGNYLLSFLLLVLLWILILIMIRQFYQINPTAAYLQIPYLLWVTFAGYLNLAFLLLNG